MTGLLSPSHIVILVIVALVVFGPRRLPEMGKSLGDGLRSFKGSIEGAHDDKPAEPHAVERV